jgi:hypothetical protein
MRNFRKLWQVGLKARDFCIRVLQRLEHVNVRIKLQIGFPQSLRCPRRPRMSNLARQEIFRRRPQLSEFSRYGGQS